MYALVTSSGGAADCNQLNTLYKDCDDGSDKRNAVVVVIDGFTRRTPRDIKTPTSSASPFWNTRETWLCNMASSGNSLPFLLVVHPKAATLGVF